MPAGLAQVVRLPVGGNEPAFLHVQRQTGADLGRAAEAEAFAEGLVEGAAGELSVHRPQGGSERHHRLDGGGLGHTKNRFGAARTISA